MICLEGQMQGWLRLVYVALLVGGLVACGDTAVESGMGVGDSSPAENAAETESESQDDPVVNDQAQTDDSDADEVNSPDNNETDADRDEVTDSQGAGDETGADNEGNTSETPGSEDISEEASDGVADSGTWLELGSQGPYEYDTLDGITIDGAEQRSMESTICSPAQQASGVGIPWMVVGHGFQLGRDLYESYCEYFASWNIGVILVSYSESGFNINHDHLAADMSALIDWVAESGNASVEHFDPNKITMAGHSLGAKIALFASGIDSRVGLVSAWDPVDGQGTSVVDTHMANLTIPVLLFGETLDSSGMFQACAPEDSNFEQFYGEAPTGTTKVTFLEADHMDWLDNPDCLFCNFCQKGDADSEDIQSMTRQITAAKILGHFEGNAALAPYWTGEAFTTEMDAGVLRFDIK